MELKEFVAETLKQVVDGIIDAQEYTKPKGATINPRGMIQNPQVGLIVADNPTRPQPPIPQMLEFDVAISVSEGKEAKAGIGVWAGAVGVGTQAKLEDGSLTVSRIKFSVPVLFPEQPTR